MERAIPGEEAIREAAAASEYTADQVRAAAECIHDVIQDDLYDYYDKAINSGGVDNLLYELGDEVVFALAPRRIARETKRYDDSLEEGQIFAAIEASLTDFQADDRTVAISGTVARSRDPPAFYPIRVKKTEEWQLGEAHALQMFEAYTSRAEMSASEALDYWVTDRMGKRPEEWAAFRNVGAEAVRKNRRQGRERKRVCTTMRRTATSCRLMDISPTTVGSSYFVNTR